MRILALTPLLGVMLAPIGLHAHPHEGVLPEDQFAEMLRQEVLALQERAKGARLGISLGNWADGPVEGLNVLERLPDDRLAANLEEARAIAGRLLAV